MTNDVVLSAALRNNLLSLQDTQNSINNHQQRLATGKKVNSALDNPQSFFAAQSLTNRANDLSNLLDSIGQSIQVIDAANNGVTALTTLINQQQSIANTAQSTLAGASTQATVTGQTNLGTGKLTLVPGINATSELQINVSNPASSTNFITNAIVTITANTTASDLVQSINDLNTSLSTPAVSASLNSSGQLVISAVGGGSLNVAFGDTTNTNVNKFLGGSAANNTTDLALAAALGFSGIATLNANGTAATSSSVDVTTSGSNTISSSALYLNNTGTLANASTLLSSLFSSTGTALTAFTGVADTLTLTVAGKTNATPLFNGSTATATIQNIIDGINHDTNIGSLVSASFNATTGQIVLSPLTSAATGAQLSFTATGAGTDKFNVGFGLNALGTTNLAPGTIATAATQNIQFGAASGTLASLQTQYNTGLAQISALVTDTGYAGTNLLNGNSLTTFFNENRTTSLTTSGTTFTAGGLGLTNANFNSAASIGSTLTQLQTALTSVRNFGSTLATNLSIIQNRQTFTTNQINTLQTGSDALTNADQNAEGASLLALQTRQSLGITSLSLASQAQQAILKLF